MRYNIRDEEKGESGENSEEETDGKLDQKIQNIRTLRESVKWIKKILIVLLAIEISLVDPLFFHIPVINDHRKCVRLDKKLGTAVVVFRSLIDSFYVIYIIAQLHKHLLVAHYRKDQDEDQYTRLGKYLFLIDFLAVLPLPQVVILIIPAMRGSRFLNAMYLLRTVVLCQFVPRSFRAYLFISSGTFGEPAMARVKFSPFVFMLGIDVIGALWYFLSIERLVQCWTKACEIHVGCVNSFYCKDNIGDHTSLKDFCPIGTDSRKTEFFDFGIFSDALQTRVVETTNFPKKLLYCFQWSLQNLSGFGQNLKTSTYISENLFAISTSILGMLLFLLLIGNLQTSMESQRKKKEKNILKAIESIENWPLLKKLSVNLKQDIKKYLKHNWENKTTDAGIILHELPTNLKKSIERALGLELLMKVKAFKPIPQNELDDLSESIEMQLFREGDCIMHEGNTTNKMVFIMQGEVEVRSSLSDINPINVLQDGDLCGEEVTWDIFNAWSSELPESTMTINALTGGLALVLPAHAVRYFLYELCYSLRRRIRHELCFDLLKKVKAFKPIGQNELDDLIDSIELLSFGKGEYIVHDGETINNMVFILQGKLDAHSSHSESNVLKDGDLYGEEVTWDELPRSTMSIKALTRVTALVIRADIVRDFLHHLPEDLKRSIRHEFER
ncbi:cyclic nucleotide-gated ion channel 1-like isoform X1 [Tripterygium wilfordii]|uniref:cyclic nucleotide-gated ion channel 1-like isoform X1 n=1 Tax=Tripterygium wilfordii TaxID=458696 RepID=UPI0018F82CAE|nr:cyclic nucleotide-gated ion channel 1-like isoform X1 [Tripterygium wilfordii]